MGYSQPIQGMDQDISPKFQQPGTYRFAQNATIETTDGQDSGSISMEQGNQICGTLSLAGARLCGSVALDDHTHLLFISTTADSRLAIYDPKSCVVNSIMITPVSGPNGDCLNLDPCFPVKAEFRVREGCKRFVYFVDGKNPMRAINIDNIPQYLIAFNIDCSLFTHTPTVASIPKFDNAEIRDTGGINVPVGVVQFAIRLINSDGGRTNWLLVSQTLPITGTLQGGRFASVHGSINEDQIVFSDEPGSVPLTTKSIALELINLDTNFEFFQIASLISGGITGVISSVYEHEEVSIESATQTYVWRGVDNASIEISLDDIIVDSTVINRVKDLTQIDNRMVLANVDDIVYDWDDVQRAANDITSQWIDTTVDSYNTKEEATSKSAEYYFKQRSYMREEVYAFGIRGRLKLGGGYTPVFHIPGRLADILTPGEISSGDAESHYRVALPSGTLWDTFLFDVADPVTIPATEIALANVKHLGFTSVSIDIGFGIGKVPRWLVFNTAVTLGSGTDTNYGPFDFGYMSYWESQVAYPAILDCNDVRVFPTGNIRHHKFPDTVLRASWDDFDDPLLTHQTNTHPIGIRFDTTSFLAALPADLTADILCWEIVRVPRTDDTSSVLDKGFKDRAPDATRDFYFNPDLDNEKIHLYTIEILPGVRGSEIHDIVITFDSPKTLLVREPLQATYFKVEDYYESVVVHGNSPPEVFELGRYPTFNGYYLSYGTPNRSILEAEDKYNVSISSSIYLDYADPVFLPANPAAESPGKPTIKDTIEGFEVGNPFWSIPRYISVLSDDHTYDGHPFEETPGGRKRQYVAYMRYNPAVYSSLTTLIYHSIDNGCDYSPNDIVFGGDTFISKWNYSEFPTLSFNDFLYEVEEKAWLNEQMSESTVNASLRTIDLTTQANNIYINGDSFIDYLNSQDLIVDPELGTNIPLEYRNYLRYNLDYSKIQQEKPEFPLSSQYDYCDDCNNKNPFRLLYSERAYQEDLTDNYRIFLANNYRDLDGETGEITNIFVQKDDLYATTNKAAYFIPVRPQTLQTNETAAFIGIGDVLSVPPKRLLTSDFSFGGCQDAESLVTTEHGTIWADGFSGRMFLLTDGLQVINKGMESFFHNNLELKLATDLRNAVSEEWECRTTLDQEFSAGMFAAYDPSVQTYYLHKKDYRLINPGTLTLLSSSSVLNDFVYDPITKRFGVATGPSAMTDLAFSDEDEFEDISWNISYHIPSESWISFHSWLPNYMFSSEDRLFTYKKSLNDLTFDVWAHRTGEYGNFWNIKHNFILEMISNLEPNRTKVFKNMSVVMDVMEFDTDKKQWFYDTDTTFTHATFYTDDQITDENRIVEKDSGGLFDAVDYLTLVVRADRTTDQWNFSELRDISINHNTEPLFTTDWDDLPGFSGGYNYVDKIVNQTIIDVNKLNFNQGRLRGEWLGARFRYSQGLGQNFKISVNVAETMEKYDMRDYKQTYRAPRPNAQR